MFYKDLERLIDEKKQRWTKASDQIWNYAETKFQETRSSEMLRSLLTQEGFAVETGVADLPTAFVASFGSGAPVIAFLGEYDALSGLSQQDGIAEKIPLIEGGNGHGCGHHLLGVGSLAAAVATKEILKENKLPGTVRYYGCPGEEGGSGKAFMARAGVFGDVDAALTWHPLAHNAIWSTRFLGNYQVAFRFHGKSSHAASAPHVGRSALDAVELMNIGVNYLREHVVPDARMHYAITNSGGASPNVVPSEAEVLYLLRAPELAQVQDIYERVCSIAHGAALMTGTTHEVIFQKACSNYIPNNALETIMYRHLQQVALPALPENEQELAQQLHQTMTQEDLQNDLHMAELLLGGQHRELLPGIRKQLVSDCVLPHVHAASLLPGSSDVGDVSWLVPTAQCSTACYVFGTPGHSWQMVAQGTSSLAHQGMLTAAKALARTALELFTQPELIQAAKAELLQTLDGRTYQCPIPPDVQPPL